MHIDSFKNRITVRDRAQNMGIQQGTVALSPIKNSFVGGNGEGSKKLLTFLNIRYQTLHVAFKFL